MKEGRITPAAIMPALEDEKQCQSNRPYALLQVPITQCLGDAQKRKALHLKVLCDFRVRGKRARDCYWVVPPPQGCGSCVSHSRRYQVFASVPLCCGSARLQSEQGHSTYGKSALQRSSPVLFKLHECVVNLYVSRSFFTFMRSI